MLFRSKHKGEVWHEITGSISEEITLDEEGNGEFSVESRNLAVWLAQLGVAFWHDLAAPVIAGIIASLIVSWLRNRK